VAMTYKLWIAIDGQVQTIIEAESEAEAIAKFTAGDWEYDADPLLNYDTNGSGTIPPRSRAA
jgi:hypothetical protein